MHRFDPIESFFSALGSGLVRILVGVAAVFCGYGLNAWANTAPAGNFMGLNTIFMIFTWGDYGAAFLIGLFCLLSGLYLLYRFIIDEGEKLSWFLVVTAFTLYYLPMNFTRVDWPGLAGKNRMESIFLALEGKGGDPVVKHDWIRLGWIFAIFAAAYWLLPLAISFLASRWIPDDKLAE